MRAFFWPVPLLQVLKPLLMASWHCCMKVLTVRLARSVNLIETMQRKRAQLAPQNEDEPKMLQGWIM